jgi:hypothetical protein
MSDGLRDGFDGAEPSGEFAPYEPRARNTTDLDIATLVEWLPRLGAVLWLHRPRRDHMFPRARLTGRGVLLLEHPDMAAFADATAIHARSAVTPHGPREWLDIDAGATTIARLYLLPDTDYLAWDAMREALGSDASPAEPRRWQAHRTFMRCAFARALRAWHARVVRLPLLRLPCLQVLGVRDVETVSALGRQLATAIIADEYARGAIA